MSESVVCDDCGFPITNGSTEDTIYASDRIAELESALQALRNAICIHMVEETPLALEEDTETDNQAVSQFLHRAAELEPDLSVANKLWTEAALLEDK